MLKRVLPSRGSPFFMSLEANMFIALEASMRGSVEESKLKANGVDFWQKDPLRQFASTTYLVIMEAFWPWRQGEIFVTLLIKARWS